MKRIATLFGLLVISVCIFAGTGNRKTDRVTLHSVTPVMESSIEAAIPAPGAPLAGTTTVNVVNTGIGNLRALLGAGRKVETDAAGNIHVGSLTGNGATYSLFYASSADGGANFDVVPDLGLTVPDRDRYPAIALSGTSVSIAYHEQNTGGTSGAYVVNNPDPLGVGVWSNPIGSLESTPSCWITFCSASPSGSDVYATWVETNGTYPTNLTNWAKSTDGGATWVAKGILGDTTVFNASGSGVVIVAGNSGYAIAQYFSSDPVALGLDTTITNYPTGNGGEWPVYCETTDGGATWTPWQVLMGTERSDYPSGTAYVDGTPRDIVYAGGTGWNNVSQGFVHNGYVYLASGATAIDLVDGYWTGVTGTIMSRKPVGIGGTWEHRVASPTPVGTTAAAIFGDMWYGELSISRPNPLNVTCTVTDQLSKAIMISASTDGGLTWNTDTSECIILRQNADLGLPGTDGAFQHPSSFFNADNMLDIVFLEDNANVVYNGSIYHTRVNVSPIVLDVSGNTHRPVEFALGQNYPNPFNPSTTIKFNLTTDSKVSLKVYNLLGQEVRTLVSGQAGRGENVVSWDGKDNTGRLVSSGMYLYKLEANGISQVKKMMLMK